MRMRIIAAVVVLGLGIAGITLAQQIGEQPRQQAIDRAKLRVQVARLRAEIELRQLEHDADSEILKKLVVDLKNLDCMEAVKGPMKEQAEALLKGPMKDQAEALKAAMKQLSPDAPGGDLPSRLVDETFSEDEAAAKVARPILERLKKEFVQKATELNEKRLELADVEKRYNEAR